MTAIGLQDIFEVDFSPIGSNNRSKEETIVMFFYDYLRLCEGELVG